MADTCTAWDMINQAWYRDRMKKSLTVGPVTVGVLLAYISGFVDTLSFVALFGLFAAHITGNIVLLATSIAEDRHGLMMKMLAIPVFVLAAVGTRLYIVRRERHQLDAAVHIMACQAVLLTVFMVVAMKEAPFTEGDHPHAVAAGLLAAAAMAIQNTAARTFFSGLPPTTVMTGNFIQVVVDLVDLTVGHEPEAKRARLAKLGPMLVAFIAGTLSGAIGYVAFGFLSLIVPIVAVGLVSIGVRHHHHAVRA
jgi:uncharacterized membrane protein YoaK (UPF0700 family)